MGNKSSSSVTIIPAEPAPMGPDDMSNKLALGAGCYWGTEKFVKKNFQERFPNSIRKAKVGFMSPHEEPLIQNPTYRQVCTGRSGHVEVLYIELNDPAKHFEELIRFFFTFHDPTTKNRQGNDAGFQYASYIFCGDEKQQEIANRVKAELQTKLEQGKIGRAFAQKQVTTNVSKLMDFTQAEPYHQDYLAKNPNGYCNHYIRLKRWPQ